MKQTFDLEITEVIAAKCLYYHLLKELNEREGEEIHEVIERNFRIMSPERLIQEIVWQIPNLWLQSFGENQPFQIQDTSPNLHGDCKIWVTKNCQGLW